MKQFKMFFILLIGMISLTSMASTPLTGQKSKITITKVTDYCIVANVQDYSFTALVVNEIITTAGVKVSALKTNANPNHYAIIIDVGWNSQRNFSLNKQYREKLNSNYLFDHDANISKLGIKRNRESC